MISKTSARRRWAALTSGALMAGGLVAAPAMAGLASASAAPVSLDYTCNATTPFGAVEMPGMVTIETTPPASAAPGATVPVGVSFDADFGSLSMGPVSQLTGSFDVPLTLGSDTATFTTAEQTAPNTALVYSDSGSVDLTAPAAAGDAPITVGTITASFSAMGLAIPGTCTPADGQDLTVGSVTVADGPVDPEPGTPGILYNCTYATFPDQYPAYIDFDADLPESIDQSSGYNPEVDVTLTWTEQAVAGFAGLELAVEPGSAHLHVNSTFAQGEGPSEIVFATSDLPATGTATWTGSGNLGVLDTSVPGTHDLSVGDGQIEANVSMKFTGGAFMEAAFDCAVAEGQDTVIGSLTVNESATGPACVDAEAKAEKAATKVAKKQAAVKKAKTAKKNAKAKVKNAKNKNAKAKAKKQLKNANAKLKKAKTQLKKAKKQLKKAEQAVADNCPAG